MHRHTHEGEKAARYISQLDHERCGGQWQLLPELARKVEKHAPSRKCLALTARVEAHVAEWIATNTGRPHPTDLAKHIPPLLTAIEQETTYPEDAFEANVCLAWVHYALGEPALALSRLPKDIQGSFETILESTRLARKWIQVCAIKGGYIKGQAQEKAGNPAEAARAYHSILPILPTPGSSMTPQLGLWTNRLLTRLCELSTISQPSGETVDFGTAIGGFRLWVQHWQNSGTLFRADQMQEVWVSYYQTLSEMLRRNIVCDATSPELHPVIVRNAQDLSPQDLLSSRLKQMAELKRAETANERILLETTTFPQASERNTEVETWVESVMDNWRILCGPTWQDEELGAGGKEAIARGVLDILYRAATKTFHSPQILRHLFTVHSYLTEFDLAMKAFDSYLEIMNRGKERDEKTGDEDLSLDTDDAFIWTNAEAIKILCRYGSFNEAERSENICDRFESWLKTHVFTSVRRPSKGSVLTEYQTGPGVSSRFVSLAHHAIGMSRANWSRWTHDVAARAGLQAKALQSFRKALDPRLGMSANVDYLYSLAFQMAEMRDLPNAIKVTKQALAPRRQEETPSLYPPEHNPSTSFQRERALMPLWHLLSLLLSCRGDYSVAAKACEAAFDQFHDASILFYGPEGNVGESFGTESDSGQVAAKNIINEMDDFEKERIVQIKMTQIALTETMEGAAAAVESTGELFALYARLFGVLEGPTTKPPAASGPPSSNGTIRASIFGRRSLRRPKTAASVAYTNTDTIPDSRPATSATHMTRATQATITPTIQVTGDDGTSDRRTSRRVSQSGGMTRSASGKLQKRRARSAEGSVKARSSISRPSSTFDANRNRESTVESPPLDSVSNTSKPDDLPAINHNLPHRKAPSPVGHQHQPPRQDTRLPTHLPGSNRVLPRPRYPQMQEDRRKVGFLIQVWLFVAGIYNRAGMHSDAKSATDEAAELVQKLEVETLGQSTSAHALSEMGWNCSKSVDELWADVWAERGTVSQAQPTPFVAQLCFEKALSYWPNHPSAIVGLSDILLDIYDKKIPPEPLENSPDALPGLLTKALVLPTTPQLEAAEDLQPPPPGLQSAIPDPAPTSPKELHRLAARDRAYGLLSSLTKLGTGWDCSEAWFSLARAYEAGGQIGKAKEVLWWCVELEDTRPVRHWRSLGVGGYVR